MLEEKDLSEIKSMIDTSIQESESRMTKQISTAIQESESRMTAYFEAAIIPKFDLLADGHKMLRKTLAPKDRVEALEEEVSFMKQVISAMSRDIAELKKAQ